MVLLLIVLLVVKGLTWLAIIGIVIFLAGLVFGGVRSRGSR